jgi:cysteine synthase A
MIMLSSRMGFSVARASTPLLRVSRFAAAQPIYTKLEHLLLTGGIFDRVAAAQVDSTREEIEQSGTAIIAGSGSTCLAFAATLSRVRAKVIAVCPRGMLAEHRLLLKMHRLELVLSEAPRGILGAADRARELSEETGGTLVYSPSFERNVSTLFAESTGRDLGLGLGNIDLGLSKQVTLVVPFVSGALIQGTVSALAAAGFRARVLATTSESASSRQDDLHVEETAPHLDDVERVVVPDGEAMTARAALARSEGLLLGLSSAGAAHVARAQQGVTIVLAVDAGDRYFSLDREAAAREASR